MTLNDLNLKEKIIHKKISELKGSIDEKEKFIRQSKFNNEYFNIQKYYYSIYKNTCNIEALKRNLFLQWYRISEPFFITGIDFLDNDIEVYNLKEIIQLLNKNYLDNELLVMFKYYYSITNWYFNEFDFLKDLIKSLEMYIYEDVKKEFITKTEDRGIMGIYWNEICSS